MKQGFIKAYQNTVVSLLRNTLLTHAAPISVSTLNIVSVPYFLCIIILELSQSLFSLLLIFLLMPFSTHTYKSTLLLFCRCLTSLISLYLQKTAAQSQDRKRKSNLVQRKSIKRSPVYNVLVRLICDLEKSTKLLFYCYLSSKAFLASFIVSP